MEGWLAEAHLPSLLAALAYRTGELGVLEGRFGPKTGFKALRTEPPGGVDPEVRADAVAAASDLIRRLGELPEPVHSDERLRAIMEFLTGLLEADYLPLLKHELALPEDAGHPGWTLSELAPGRKFTAVVIGAGMSGLAAAHRLRQAGVPVTVFERRPDLGGVWHDNDYPGARLDTSNFNYSYSFSQHGEWEDQFSPRDAVLDYLRGLAEDFGLREAIRFDETVTEGRYDEKSGLWSLVVMNSATGARTVVDANVLISAVGQLNEPYYPEIPGLGSFSGPVWHTARWRHDVPIDGLRLGVIGTGASAFQVIPPLAKAAAHLSVFQRTPAWVLPTPGYNLPLDPGFRHLLSTTPYYYRFYRFTQFWRNVEGLREFAVVDPAWEHPVSVSEANEAVRAVLEESLRTAFADRPDLVEKLLPAYPPYAKRSVRDDGTWAEALQRDNVDVITDSIERVTPDGIVVAGETIALDAIVLGTGFRASEFLASLSLTGLDGQTLEEYWGGDARAKYGSTIPGFPNLFCLYGPNTNVNTNGSVVLFVELALEYAMSCVGELLRRDAKAMVLREEVFEEFYERLDEAAKGLAVGHSTVNSWYRNRFGRVSQNWPLSTMEFWRGTRGPGNDYDYL
ncbi:NAD(P)/FAD-dependent oxidoreductase [Leifsonia bigeumensis]|uniref:NAD(P)/FAD-dependent oxidoreductase n=1 Tax=Leifsonella bigeumensis TaxID=433643 RepID=A0ABP7FGK2_9MICO